jgi:hypothetical protein
MPLQVLVVVHQPMKFRDSYPAAMILVWQLFVELHVLLQGFLMVFIGTHDHKPNS